MPNYLVTYKINDADAKSRIEDFLISQELNHSVDESTKFGMTKCNKETFVKLLKKARMLYGLNERDEIFFYYSTLNKDKYPTMNFIKI